MATGKLLHISVLQLLALLNGDSNSFPFPLRLWLKIGIKCQVGNCFGNYKVIHIVTMIAILS